jgi:hypothetical protein
LFSVQAPTIDEVPVGRPTPADVAADEAISAIESSTTGILFISISSRTMDAQH